eukprot:6455271-Amphidinium_carterae.1
MPTLAELPEDPSRFHYMPILQWRIRVRIAWLRWGTNDTTASCVLPTTSSRIPKQRHRRATAI